MPALSPLWSMGRLLNLNLLLSWMLCKNGLILPTGQWYAPSTVINDAPIMHYLALSCTVLHYLALFCTIMHYLALSYTIMRYLELSCTIMHHLTLSCTILHYLALSCTILHYHALSCTILQWCPVVPIRYTCSQQMSPVIAFDIAVVPQKVKVQYWGPVWSEKVGGGSLVGRDGY